VTAVMKEIFMGNTPLPGSRELCFLETKKRSSGESPYVKGWNKTLTGPSNLFRPGRAA
jgi:hypothetical protein